MPRDKYSSYDELSAYEPEGAAYAIKVTSRPSPIAIVAPHGGGIERGTSEIATAIAGKEYALYLFEGMKSKGNEDLHLTSANFDEPRCREVLRRAATVVTIHGVESDQPLVHLGGLDQALIGRLTAELRSAGFAGQMTDDPAIAGRFRSNICNQGSSGRGCQLEISSGLRAGLFRDLERAGRRHPTPQFGEFVEAVRRALPSPRQVD